jgi:TPR repeat protein
METTAGQAMRACALYQTLSKTGSYDELMECIIRMRPALLTSFNALDEMEARFPEHKAALDLCRMQWVTLYFGGSVDGSWPDTWAFDLNLAGANKQFLDAFKKIDDQYPKAAFEIAGLMRERPYNMLAERCKKEKNLRGAAEYYFKAMQVSRAGMHQFNGRYVSGMSYILFYEADKFFRKNPKLLPLSTPEQWQSFAAIHGIPVRMALELAYGFDANTLATQYKSDKGPYYGNGYPEVIDKLKISDVLRQLADKGDPDAMNAMAVRYAAGVEGKAEDAIPLFRKAAEAGSLWAHVNLIQATYWGLKDYGPENRPTAKTNLRKFLESASPDDILMAGKILENDANTARIYLETEDHIFSKELIKTAARLGQWNAAERVAYEKW